MNGKTRCRDAMLDSVSGCRTRECGCRQGWTATQECCEGTQLRKRRYLWRCSWRSSSRYDLVVVGADNTFTGEIHKETMRSKKISSDDGLGNVCNNEIPRVFLAAEYQLHSAGAERSDGCAVCSH